MTEANKEKRWRPKWPFTRDETFKAFPIFISLLSLCATTGALLYTSATFRHAQDQFEVSNRPFIELSEIRIDSVGAGKSPVFSFKLTNKGKFPAKVIYLKNYEGGAAPTATADEIIKAEQTSLQPLNPVDTTVGIIPFSPAFVQRIQPTSTALNVDQVNAMKSGQAAFTLHLEIEYQNLVTKTRYHYIQIVKIAIGPSLSFISAKYQDDPD